MTDTITLPRSVVEQALEALKIGHESAHDCAETFHIEMAGYKQQRHEALDAEVKQISDAVGVLRAALEQPQDHHEQHLDMVPGGWKLVPMEPTKGMKTAGAFAAMDQVRRSYNPPSAYIPVDSMALLSYRAMLAAAPQPPVVEQPQVEQVPVAYFYTRSGRVVSTEATDALMQQMIGESGRVALYAHPQPPRQPLTDKVIQELAEEGVFHANIFEIVRRIEEEHGIFKLRAHGIGGEA